MPIPDFQTLMRPLLDLHSDAQEHINRDLVNALAQKFSVTEDERRQMLPSGRAKLFDNRVGWAKNYLVKADLLSSPRRAISVITAEGARVFRQHSGPINIRFLSDLAESRPKPEKAIIEKADADSQMATPEETESPEEAFDNSYVKIRTQVEREIIEKILANPPSFLERVIVDLVVKMGYGGTHKDAGEAIGRSGDEGIDGIIKEDPLGLDIIYLQAKRYEGTVGRPEIQKFAGALQGQRANKGIFITTSTYSKEAKEFVAKIGTKIILIDGPMLARLMFDYGIGVAVNAVYEVKKVDLDYFEDL